MRIFWGLVCVWIGVSLAVLWPPFIQARRDARHAERWGFRRCTDARCRICGAWERGR